MNKKIIILVLFLVIFSFNVSARRAENFSASDAYGWLLQQSEEGAYNNDIVDTSAAFLALDVAGGLATAEKEYIVTQMNDNNCWPKAGCKIEDTVWAMFALHKYGETEMVTSAETWLKKAQTPTLTGGNWILQIDTPDSGTCKLTYSKGETEFTKDIEVDAGSFPGCGGKTFFDLKNCIESGLLSTYASLELGVDCSNLGSAKISIAYNSGSSYYLYEEVSEKTATLIVKNGCFGSVYKDPSCGYYSSLYAEWIFNEIGLSLSSELYLREDYDDKNAIQNALLYEIYKDKEYAAQLVSLQKSDGSWNSKALDTAFAIIALRENGGYSQYVEKAKDWLKERQQEDGSWEGEVFTTAMVLYSSFYSGTELPSCTDGVKNQGERGIDCGGPCEFDPYDDDCCFNAEKDDEEDGIDCGGKCEECAELVCDDSGTCDEAQGENCYNCPNDCLSCEDLCSNAVKDTASDEENVDCGGYCPSCTANVCNNDGNCEYDLTERYSDYTDNEDSENCPNDCYCGDGICDDYEQGSGECTADCGASAFDAECGDGTCDEGEDISCPDDCTGDYICNNDGSCDLDIGEDCDCSDCEEEDFCTGEGGGLKWILILLVIVLLGGGGYFLFTKMKGKPKQGEPSFKYGSSFKPGSF
ncbi:MAG: hypothetical protein KKA79_00285, partial [Nanoarchaeota archaeon]|nr:hypothetical protein [Nanoarchaeota archaeon]